MTTHIKKISDTTIDLLDKVSTSTSRAGTTIERAGKMYAKGVPKKVIAVQLTENSKSGNEYQGNRTTKPLKSKNRLNCEQKGEPSCSPIRLTI